jgi:uncharacterized protein YndB with AHSA1/START domain
MTRSLPGDREETRMAHPFELTNEIQVDATPDEVWEAIATGTGMDAWFMGSNEIEPREGGLARTEGSSGWAVESTVTTWDPPNRFAYRTGEGEDGSLHSFEYVVESHERGNTAVRWIHTGFLGDDNWEAEYEGMSEGDPMYLHQLGQYLTYFRGRRATPIEAVGPKVADRDQAWATYRRGLGLEAHPELGDEIRLTPEGFEPIEGVVDYLSPSFLGVRTDDALYRFIYGFDGTVVLGHHLYSDVDGEQTQRAWGSWLTGLFA